MYDNATERGRHPTLIKDDSDDREDPSRSSLVDAEYKRPFIYGNALEKTHRFIQRTYPSICSPIAFELEEAGQTERKSLKAWILVDARPKTHTAPMFKVYKKVCRLIVMLNSPNGTQSPFSLIHIFKLIRAFGCQKRQNLHRLSRHNPIFNFQMIRTRNIKIYGENDEEGVLKHS